MKPFRWELKCLQEHEVSPVATEQHLWCRWMQCVVQRCLKTKCSKLPHKKRQSKFVKLPPETSLKMRLFPSQWACSVFGFIASVKEKKSCFPAKLSSQQHLSSNPHHHWIPSSSTLYTFTMGHMADWWMGLLQTEQWNNYSCTPSLSGLYSKSSLFEKKRAHNSNQWSFEWCECEDVFLFSSCGSVQLYRKLRKENRYYYVTMVIWSKLGKAKLPEFVHWTCSILHVLVRRMLVWINTFNHLAERHVLHHLQWCEVI